MVGQPHRPRHGSGSRAIVPAHAGPAQPPDDGRSGSSVPEYQYQNDDRDRDAEKPQKNTLTHGLPPIRYEAQQVVRV